MRIPTHILIDLDRQYLVHFIADSSAGFTVRDVKLTGGLSEAGLHLRRHGFRWNMVKPGEKDVKTPTTGIY